MCKLSGVSRAGYYRHWAASAPRQEETAVRDAIQRLALAHRHYGYRLIAAQLRHEGLAVNRKRVLRLMREDNLLCLRGCSFVPVTTYSRHDWRVVPNLVNLRLSEIYSRFYVPREDSVFRWQFGVVLLAKKTLIIAVLSPSCAADFTCSLSAHNPKGQTHKLCRLQCINIT